MIAIWTGLLLASAHAIECVKPVSPAELDEALAKAETEYVDLNEIGFRDRVNEAAGLLLPCLADPLPLETVAHHHRVMAMHLLMIGDEPGALKAVEAAKVAQPDYAFPDELLPADHPVRAHYDAYAPEVATRTVPEPRSGSIAFDGANSRKRPKTHPTIAQLFDPQGLAQSTTYLGPRDPLPPYRAIPRQRNMLIVGSGASLAVSGLMYGLAWGQRGNLFKSAQDQSLSADVLDGKRARTNALTFTSGAFFGIAVGAGVGAALIGER
ncbi:MAG: hypothetical protein H6737_26775 [Alphaproteobacteria bacterium]|nr:hypothetical protein [Alphaproteobacteria bacterium]